MARLVVDGATLTCSMGKAPARLTVLPTAEACAGLCLGAATVQDVQPGVNIASFGLCSSPSNPQVAAATAAAMGVLTPQPCVPMTTAPWTPGAQTVTVGEHAALSDACMCACQWGGQIEVQDAGQTEVEID
jgi:hypothetical protein